MLPQLLTCCLCSSRDSMPRWADQSYQSEDKCRLHPRGDTIHPLSRERGHRWRRLFHPILLHCALLSLVRTNRFMCTASSVNQLRACDLCSNIVFLLFLLVEAAAHCGSEPGVRLLGFKAWLYHCLVTPHKLPKPLLLRLASGDKDTGNLRRYFLKILGYIFFAISSLFSAFLLCLSF